MRRKRNQIGVTWKPIGNDFWPTRRICIDSTLTVPDDDDDGRKTLAKCGRDNEVWRVTHVATLDYSIRAYAAWGSEGAFSMKTVF